MEKKELFSKKVSAGARTYFFDVKETVNGGKYLTICESKKVDDGFERHRVMIFNDNLQSFTTGLEKAVKFMKEE